MGFALLHILDAPAMFPQHHRPLWPTVGPLPCSRTSLVYFRLPHSPLSTLTVPSPEYQDYLLMPFKSSPALISASLGTLSFIIQLHRHVISSAIVFVNPQLNRR
ncbi:hypothetical protein M422DRAFT_29356 [Sphaerobolus stellatus SS14]|uniref:Uncharacterized protein n=1 Tax=Sphaerobolus stellatus (strain SS14) TaxID=990650 RepID=A0A0C9W499_SPHS4|nr:hypothetical protein M422DRAFT_29356 [Sphaerobolus stellatus SS14]